MERHDLAMLLARSTPEQRRQFLANGPRLANAELAQALALVYIEAISGDPLLALNAAAALTELATSQATPAIQAYADWVAGMAALQMEGRPEHAILLIDAAAASFSALGQPEQAAATQSSKIFALAMLGRYDEAITCGMQARHILIAARDKLGAGKIEQNLGNIYHRRGQYQDAETHYRAAQAHFAAVEDQRMLAFAENGLANVLTLQHRPNEALRLYEQAMSHARAAGALVTQAEIACNLGVLALATGHYNEALNYLETSRRQYNELGMEHEALHSELELADAYLELNMASAAATSYGRIVDQFQAQGLRAELARAYAGWGRASLLQGQLPEAQSFSELARDLYTAEGNAVGAGLATMTLAQIAYLDHAYANAAELAATVETVFAKVGAVGYLLLSRWLHGEARRLLGQTNEARQLLHQTLADASPDAPQIAQRCHTSLGMLALSSGDRTMAEQHLNQACDLIEGLRANLNAEDLRVAFVADKLTPFLELARICLSDTRYDRNAEALNHVERARARTLLDLLRQEWIMITPPIPEQDALRTEFATLRREARWFDSQLARLSYGETNPAASQVTTLRYERQRRESQLRELDQRLSQQAGSGKPYFQLDLGQLQQELDHESVLIEYVYLDDEVLAFIVDAKGITVERGLANVSQVQMSLHQLRFQLGTLRYGARLGAAAYTQLTLRTQHHLRALYRQLLAPLERHIGERAMVVVPHRDLYYVPFHALHDGEQYVIERREVTYVPSAQVFQSVAARPVRPFHRTLLLGVPDQRTPRLEAEITALAALLPQALCLTGSAATSAALRLHGANADLIHLACHGEFRPDSPLLSALHLADGPLTVQAIYQLALGSELAVLSACETGMHAIEPGDEIFGLVRGFFAAGVSTLVVSLWTVDDSSTTDLMRHFYQALLQGQRPATALRQAQLASLQQHSHPFYWAPFTLIGRR
ncbi:MAG: CHAT domain-containing protein [Oscillochloridaceae bacterium umkhey_bin13]